MSEQAAFDQNHVPILTMVVLYHECSCKFSTGGALTNFVCLVININLKEDHLHPGNTMYAKLKSQLQTLGTFTVIILWEPPADDICPSSVAKYFFDLGYKVKSCAPNFTSNLLYSIKAPLVNFDNVDESNIIDFIEWLGMISICGDLEDDQNYISSFETPTPNIELGPVKYLQWRGLFSTRKIKDFIGDLRKYVDLEQKPWIAIYVQGFSDSPVAWGIEEHHYYTNGDNGYILIFNTKEYLFCSQKCSKKRYK